MQDGSPSRASGPASTKGRWSVSAAGRTTGCGNTGPARAREGAQLVAFWRDDQGQGLVEYALIIVVIAIAVIVAMVFLRSQLQVMFSNIGNNLT